MDAIDVALVHIKDDVLEVVNYNQYPIPKELQLSVRSITDSSTINNITELDIALGEQFATAVQQTLKSTHIRADEIKAIGSHGQTVLHLADTTQKRSLQIGDPNIIAYKTSITTVADFRRLDIAAGGQGAPLAPAFHQWYFRDHSINRVILNIGGIANITVLPIDTNRPILGFDTGPGNGLMDAWTQRHLNCDFDDDGKWAGSGIVDNSLLEILLADPYFADIPPKSTGKDNFNLNWLDKKLELVPHSVQGKDIQATLLELAARIISDAINEYADSASEILICGGGIHNPLLISRLSEMQADCTIASTEIYGIHPDAVEAISFAWLAMCRIENIESNIPSVTGATRKVTLGAVYQP